VMEIMQSKRRFNCISPGRVIKVGFSLSLCGIGIAKNQPEN
jgi:hypothetical protein